MDEIEYELRINHGLVKRYFCNDVTSKILDDYHSAWSDNPNDVVTLTKITKQIIKRNN